MLPNELLTAAGCVKKILQISCLPKTVYAVRLFPFLELIHQLRVMGNELVSSIDEYSVKPNSFVSISIISLKFDWSE
jgi:hypothetical protein